MKRFSLISFLAFAFLVTSQEIAFGEGGIVWDPNGVPICTASRNQQNIKMVADGSGDAIIVWEDWRNGNWDIFAQRIDKNGKPAWTPDGMLVCGYTGDQVNPVIINDGSGGAIIAWQDRRYIVSPRIYALRISGDTGKPSWTEKAVTDSTPTQVNQSSPDIASDGDGGAIIVWQEKLGTNWSICARGISMDGILKWLVVVSSSAIDTQANPKIINDGQGCVIITWEDLRNGNYDIYAQRLDIGSGSPTAGWGPNGNAVCLSIGTQMYPQIASDGSGGAIIVWTDCRDSVTLPDIYAQRIKYTGMPVWTTGGIPICQASGNQDKPFIINSLVDDIIEGAIIAWEDKRQDLNGDIYAEKVPLYVGTDWTGGGKEMATGNQKQICPRLVSDNQGGGIITWIENDLISSPYKIFASKRDQNGDPVWSIYPGVLVYKGTEVVDHQIVSDGSGGVIVAWASIGAGGDYDIYAQRVSEDSISGRVTLSNGEKGIAGVEVEALKDGQLVSSVITDTNGYYGLTGLIPDTTYTVRAMWTVNGIESSVSMEAVAPSYRFDFTLEIDYFLGTIAGNVSGVEREAKRVSGSGLGQSLSSASGIAFVELEQRGKVIARVPVDTEGNYSIPNLLPGRFIARAYNGTIYSNPRVVNLKEGETLRVDFAFGIMPEETVFNYPNPAKSGSTTIRYYCGYADPEAEVKIYNIAGELVRKVKDTEIDKADAPIYKFLWDCKNTSGKEVASGIYIYIVEVKEKSNGETKKVIKRMAVVR
jgi:hypothetical protein